MKSEEIRERFLKFFEERGHRVVPSSSLIPDDPSVLLTTAGMQQFKKYYTGELDAMNDFGSKNTVSIQKSFRTSDIDEVGDSSHLTFFEMMGNFSFGGYFKKEAIAYAFDFITKEMGLPISYVTVFQGSGVVPTDEESKTIWRSLGVSDVREEGMDDVFWGPTGSSGPCGPTTEIYCKNGVGQDVEVWNIVFNEFFCDGSRDDLISGKMELKSLPFKGIDTGMSFERLTMCVQKMKTIFETDLFDFLPDKFLTSDDAKIARVIADHVRGAVFLILDGVEPSNKGAGYALRRLIRKALVSARKLNTDLGDMRLCANNVVEKYAALYPELKERKALILDMLGIEFAQSEKIVEIGIREFEKRFGHMKPGHKVSGKDIFMLHQSYGTAVAITLDLAKEHSLIVDEEEVREAENEHKDISHVGSEKKFGGHGLIFDTGELKAGSEEELKKVIRLHTATHLLHQALRDVLGDEVRQAGSDITTERTRFDFSFPRKLTTEEVKKVEEVVNQKINEALPVSFQEMSKEEAGRTGALHFFKEKYPDRVKVYFVGKSLDEAYSKEFCGGPHVENTSEIGMFRIVKEEAVGAGTRRIRGILS